MNDHTPPQLDVMEILRVAAARLAKLCVPCLEPERIEEGERHPTPTFKAHILAKFVSPGDVATRHVTINLNDLVKLRLLPKPHGLKQGDKILGTIDGIYTEWKVNRRNARTAAAKLDPRLPLPVIDQNGYHKTFYYFEMEGMDIQ